ncbi:MAG: hypothetical protein AABW82_04410 [Nanoarchaeota archaeon]
MELLNKLFNPYNKNSISSNFRKRRFEIFLRLIKNIKKPVRIIDIGGKYIFWKNMDFPKDKYTRIIMLNLEEENLSDPRFKNEIGDATNITGYNKYKANFVFSNSLIEHLSTFENQKRMAQQVISLKLPYYIQTPNKYFPIEPHTLIPFFQFMPMTLRLFLAKNLNFYFYNKEKNTLIIEERAREIRLLTKKELKELFPEAQIYEEKFLGLTKSFIVYQK